MKKVYESPIGLTVYYREENDRTPYTITGNVSRKHTIREMESAYDFEQLVKNKVQHVGIVFDSEYSQFWAYAKTENLAVNFVKNCENYLAKVKEMLY